MRRRDVKIGMLVLTMTASGQYIECTVRERVDERQWLLDSPAHGYAIVRHHTEFQPVKK
jgi:hypothetical protein